MATRQALYTSKVAGQLIPDINPDSVEGNEQFEANNAPNKVVAESMGPGYPEVVRGTRQM